MKGFTIQNKIILLGLAETGKTTILKVVSEGYKPEKKAAYTATIDYDRKTIKIFGKEVSVFDIGGQKSFLDRFTGELAEFIFSNVKIMIFVIDITEVSKLSIAKYYLKLCLEKLDAYSPKGKVFLLLHKTDKINQAKMTEFSNNLKKYLTQDIEKHLNMYETTVFDNSILSALETIVGELDTSEVDFKSIVNNFYTKYRPIIPLIQMMDEKGKLAYNHADFDYVNYEKITTKLDEIREMLDDQAHFKAMILQTDRGFYYVERFTNDYLLLIYTSVKNVQGIYSKIIILSAELTNYFS